MSCSAKLQTNINMIIIPIHGYPRKIHKFFNKKGVILKIFSATHHQMILILVVRMGYMEGTYSFPPGLIGRE